MINLVLPLKLLLALALGAVIGLERESQIRNFRKEHKDTPLIGSMGGFTYFCFDCFSWSISGYFKYIFFISFFIYFCRGFLFINLFLLCGRFFAKEGNWVNYRIRGFISFYDWVFSYYRNYTLTTSYCYYCNLEFLDVV